MTVLDYPQMIEPDRKAQVWRRLAACRDLDTDLFFPNGETGMAVDQVAEAKAVCATCPVRAQCLDFALVNNEPYGIFGGLTEEERRALRRRQARERRQQQKAS